eukprot:3847878-Prymnesium_polylepis.1
MPARGRVTTRVPVVPVVSVWGTGPQRDATTPSSIRGVHPEVVAARAVHPLDLPSELLLRAAPQLHVRRPLREQVRRVDLHVGVVRVALVVVVVRRAVEHVGVLRTYCVE